MKKHEILSPQSRAALFDPPTDPAAIVRHYTFSPEDMALIRQRRRAANRLGFAVHLAYLRFPGRVLRRRRNAARRHAGLHRGADRMRSDGFCVICTARAKRAGNISANCKPISTCGSFRREDTRAVVSSRN